MPPRNRRILKVGVVFGSVVTAPAALVTANLARDQVGWPLALTLGAGGSLLALSVGLGFVYQWIQKHDDRLDVEVMPKAVHPTLPSFAQFISWIDAHVDVVDADLMAVLNETIRWTTRRIAHFDASDPEGWKPVVHECTVGDLEVLERRRNSSEVLSEDETLQLEAFDGWRRRPVLGLPYRATFLSRDKRSIGEYRSEVSRYLASYRRALRRAAVNVWIENEFGALRIAVTNHSEKPVEAIEVVVKLPQGLSVVTPYPKRDLATPRRIPKLGDVDYGMGVDDHNRYLMVHAMIPSIPSADEPKIDGSTVTYSEIVVTSGASVTLPAVHLLTREAVPQVFDLTWDAASKKSTPGRCNGSLRAGVNSVTLDVVSLMTKMLRELDEI